MKVAVKFYKDTNYQKDQPDMWPAEVIELTEGVKAPDDWTVMSVEEYNEHRAKINFVSVKQAPEPQYKTWYQTITGWFTYG